ncbi:P-loop ATPase, Sll1717 family [Janthinobacterium lividum]
MNWEKIANLKEPYNDAINYRGRQYKEFFQRIFLTTEELERVLHPQVYFLMGEKGAGKTAYAVYLENNETKNHKCKLTTMTETQYKRFIAMKRQGKLSFSDYSNIWRSMLLFITGRMLVEKSKTPLHFVTGKFSKIEKEIQKWSKNALNPEVESAFEVLNSEILSAKIKNEQIGEAGGEQKKESSEKTSTFRHHLMETEASLKEAISSLKLDNGHILFIDGIDYRPETVPYLEYIECIKGLGEAVWQLNTEFFNNIRDSKGRIKVVLLVRPDVFHALNLYNSNSRLQDNCVFLDWSTTEREYASSKLFEVSGKYFSSQQNFTTTPSDAWDQYYISKGNSGHTFKHLLKNSFHKPRDILTFVKITQKYCLKGRNKNATQFPAGIANEPAITREFSDYLLGEIKNYSAFYMAQDDFNKYLKFFQYLNGKSKFSMTEFNSAFKLFKAWADGESFSATLYLRDSDSLLQLLYDINVVGYSENVEGGGGTFFHWSYRERSANNIAPKVKTTGLLILNPGIAKALDIGKIMVDAQGTPSGPRSLHAAHRKNNRRYKGKKNISPSNVKIQNNKSTNKVTAS